MESANKNALLQQLAVSPEVHCATRSSRASSMAWWCLLSFALGLLVSAAFFQWMRPSAVESAKSTASVETTVSAVAGPEVGAQADTVLNAIGYAKAGRETTVSSNTTGRIVSLHVTEGQKVNKGDLIARVENRQTALRAEIARHSLLLAKIKRKEARIQQQISAKNLQRSESLRKSGVFSQKSYEDEQLNADLADERLAAAQHEVASLEKQYELAAFELSEAEIRAPFSGSITTLNAQVGEIVSPISGGGYIRTGIATIVDPDSIEIQVEVPESKMSMVRREQPVRVGFNAIAGKAYHGRVGLISSWIIKGSSTVLVKIDILDKDPDIVPNMEAHVSFLKDTA